MQPAILKPEVNLLTRKAYRLIRFYDCLDYPVALREMADWLNADAGDIRNALEGLRRDGALESRDDFYFTPGKTWTLLRRAAARENYLKHRRAILGAVRGLSLIPFVRGVLLLGDAARGVLHEKDELEFLVLVRENRLWLCRTLLLAARIILAAMGSRPAFIRPERMRFHNDRIMQCMERNEYQALELACACPVYNERLCAEFIRANAWSQQHFHPLRDKRLAAEKAYFNPLKIILETVFDVFWSRKWEQRMLRRHFRNRFGAHADHGVRHAFGKHTGLGCIKPQDGERSALLLNRLRKTNDRSPWDYLQTLSSLRQATGAAGGADLVLAFAAPESRATAKPPAELVGAADNLRRLGFTAEIHPADVRRRQAAFACYLTRRRTPLVTVYATEEKRRETEKMIRVCRQMNIPVIAAGPDGLKEPQQYLQCGAYLIAMPPMERTLEAILGHLKMPTRPVHEIPGVYLGPVSQ